MDPASRVWFDAFEEISMKYLEQPTHALTSRSAIIIVVAIAVWLKLPIALAETACKESVDNLNQLLADTMTLRHLYKKHHWQVAGPTFYQLHLLFDKHYDQEIFRMR
jgi:starvation-inducible DNA-binding protein